MRRVLERHADRSPRSTFMHKSNRNKTLAAQPCLIMRSQGQPRIHIIL